MIKGQNGNKKSKKTNQLKGEVATKHDKQSYKKSTHGKKGIEAFSFLNSIK